jgi:proline iminopeptidase
MHRLYPARKAYHTEFLATEDRTHQLCLELHGNPDGLPVICLHGGPGAGTSPMMHRFFDLDKFHVLCFDQRGAGRSLPVADLTANTTEHLIDDISWIAAHVGFKRFALFGGSWGATLALLYASRHVENILGIVLRGAFLATEQDLLWLYGGGAEVLYPAAWRDFLAPIRGVEPTLDAILAAYGNALTCDDEFQRNRAARAWNLWESRVSICDPTVPPKAEGTLARDYAMARIEHHYVSQGCFLEPGAVLASVADLEQIPAELVHGQRDHVCLVQNAHSLKAHWPNLRLELPERGGHSAFTPEMAEALCRATARLANRYGY